MITSKHDHQCILFILSYETHHHVTWFTCTISLLYCMCHLHHKIVSKIFVDGIGRIREKSFETSAFIGMKDVLENFLHDRYKDIKYALYTSSSLLPGWRHKAYVAQDTNPSSFCRVSGYISISSFPTKSTFLFPTIVFTKSSLTICLADNVLKCHPAKYNIKM